MYGGHRDASRVGLRLVPGYWAWDGCLGGRRVRLGLSWVTAAGCVGWPTASARARRENSMEPSLSSTLLRRSLRSTISLRVGTLKVERERSMLRVTRRWRGP